MDFSWKWQKISLLFYRIYRSPKFVKIFNKSKYTSLLPIYRDILIIVSNKNNIQIIIFKITCFFEIFTGKDRKVDQSEHNKSPDPAIFENTSSTLFRVKNPKVDPKARNKRIAIFEITCSPLSSYLQWKMEIIIFEYLLEWKMEKYPVDRVYIGKSRYIYKDRIKRKERRDVGGRRRTRESARLIVRAPRGMNPLVGPRRQLASTLRYPDTASNKPREFSHGDPWTGATSPPLNLSPTDIFRYISGIFNESNFSIFLPIFSKSRFSLANYF